MAEYKHCIVFLLISWEGEVGYHLPIAIVPGAEPLGEYLLLVVKRRNPAFAIV